MSNDVNKSLNTILYGPPGTGKTYSAVERAVKIIDGNIIDDREKVMERYKELAERGQIKFCTFHQSYGYEEFVEGLRIDDDGKFNPKMGIFRTICKNALDNRVNTTSMDNVNFYKMPLGLDDDEGKKTYQACIDKCFIANWCAIQGNFSECDSWDSIKNKFNDDDKLKLLDDKANKINTINLFKNVIKEGDIILIENKGVFEAVAKVIGKYQKCNDSNIVALNNKHLRKVEWICKNSTIPRSEIITDISKLGSNIQEVDKSIINIDKLNEYIVSDNNNNAAVIQNNYVLIIDEINRGNISKIFGELITLIEDDKRIDGKNEVKVTLPYSNESFGIPRNLYIIGTMNTADRSIALLDTALRRRFRFEELIPKHSEIKGKDGKPKNIGDDINLGDLLKTMNDRIAFLYDREHTIGHAYFMEVETAQDLIDVMTGKILPLLQEYFYDDWDKIKLVLGGASADLIEPVLLQAETLFGKTIEGYDNKKNSYKFKEIADDGVFKKILKVSGKKENGKIETSNNN